MTIRKVGIVGAGVLGSQIAFQSAVKGLAVTAYDLDEPATDEARTRLDTALRSYLAEVPGAQGDGVTAAALERVTLTHDLAATAQADLVIETAPENLELKRQLFATLAALAPPEAIFATGSSAFVPSVLADATGRADRFLGLHFTNRIWTHNIAEVMGSPDTDPAVFDDVVEFTRAIGMVPIELHRERTGYVLDSLRIPFLRAALTLVAGGYAEPEAVDAAWRIGTGAPAGPFQMADDIGLAGPYRVLAQGDTTDRDLAGWLKRNYLDKGRLGVATGAGFYKYL